MSNSNTRQKPENPLRDDDEVVFTSDDDDEDDDDRELELPPVESVIASKQPQQQQAPRTTLTGTAYKIEADDDLFADAEEFRFKLDPTVMRLAKQQHQQQFGGNDDEDDDDEFGEDDDDADDQNINDEEIRQMIAAIDAANGPPPDFLEATQGPTGQQSRQTTAATTTEAQYSSHRANSMESITSTASAGSQPPMTPAQFPSAAASKISRLESDPFFKIESDAAERERFLRQRMAIEKQEQEEEQRRKRAAAAAEQQQPPPKPLTGFTSTSNASNSTTGGASAKMRNRRKVPDATSSNENSVIAAGTTAASNNTNNKKVSFRVGSNSKKNSNQAAAAAKQHTRTNSSGDDSRESSHLLSASAIVDGKAAKSRHRSGDTQDEQQNGTTTGATAERKRRTTSSSSSSSSSSFTTAIYASAVNAWQQAKAVTFSSTRTTVNALRASPIGTRLRYLDDSTLVIVAFLTLLLSIILTLTVGNLMLRHRKESLKLRAVEEKIERFRTAVTDYQRAWDVTSGKDSSGFLSAFFSPQMQHQMLLKSDQAIADEIRNHPDSADVLRYTPVHVNLGAEFEAASVERLEEQQTELQSSVFQQFVPDDHYLQQQQQQQQQQYSYSSLVTLTDIVKKQTILTTRLTPQEGSQAGFFLMLNRSGITVQQHHQHSKKQQKAAAATVNNSGVAPENSKQQQQKKQQLEEVPRLAAHYEGIGKAHSGDDKSSAAFVVRNVMTAEEASADDVRVFQSPEEVEESMSNPVVAPAAERGYRAFAAREHESALKQRSLQQENSLEQSAQRDRLHFAPQSEEELAQQQQQHQQQQQQDGFAAFSSAHHHHHHHLSQQQRRKKRADYTGDDAGPAADENAGGDHGEAAKSWSDEVFLCSVCVMVRMNSRGEFELVQQSDIAPKKLLVKSDNNNSATAASNKININQPASCHYPFTQQTYCEISFADEDYGAAMNQIAKDRRQQQLQPTHQYKHKSLFSNQEEPDPAAEHGIVQSGGFVARRSLVDGNQQQQQQQRRRGPRLLSQRPQVVFEVRLWNDPLVQLEILSEGDPRAFRESLAALRAAYRSSETTGLQRVLWAAFLTVLVGACAFCSAELWARRVVRQQSVALAQRRGVRVAPKIF